LAKQMSTDAPSVDASVFYSAAEGCQKEDRSDAPPETLGGEVDVRMVRITNGRLHGHTLDAHGFTLSTLDFASVEGMNYYDASQMNERMYPLAVDVLRRCFPRCKQILVFDHLVRNNARVEQDKANGRTTPLLAGGPAFKCHGDYTVRSAIARAHQLLEPHESQERIEAALGQRFALVNVWVPLAAVRKDPLGMIEWESQHPDDVQIVKLSFKHRIGEVYRVMASDHHRWVYYPDMQQGECLVFKVFDSTCDTARFSLHGAVQDPTTKPDAPERESVEIRCIVLFGELPEGFGATFIAPHLVPGSLDQGLHPERVEVLPSNGMW